MTTGKSQAKRCFLPCYICTYIDEEMSFFRTLKKKKKKKKERERKRKKKVELPLLVIKELIGEVLYYKLFSNIECSY